MNNSRIKLIAPSILSADFLKLGEQLALVENAEADIFHCDIMDGQFVPNITFGPMVVEAVRKATKLPLDVHLMIKTTDGIIREFAKAGANYITVHAEEVIHLHRTLELIKQLGVKAGVSINPSTPVHALDSILEYADLLLIMSVNPGFGGQKFIPSVLKKVEALREKKERNNYHYLIEIDGGINRETIEEASRAGVEVFVAGSAVFHAQDIAGEIKTLKNLAVNAL